MHDLEKGNSGFLLSILRARSFVVSLLGEGWIEWVRDFNHPTHYPINTQIERKGGSDSGNGEYCSEHKAD